MNEQIREKEIRIIKSEEEVKKIYNKGAIGGTFDLFHVGHEKFLSCAAKMCKKLEDKYGPATEDKELEALFVTINTLQSAIEIK
jgi:phosphopantetheine adenylyltransferase